MSSTSRIPFRVKPMLATLVSKPFHADFWVYEEKYDGDRLLAYKEGTPSSTALSKCEGPHSQVSEYCISN